MHCVLYSYTEHNCKNTYLRYNTIHEACYFSWGCCFFGSTSTLHYKHSFAKITLGVSSRAMSLAISCYCWELRVSSGNLWFYFCEFLNWQGGCSLAGKLAPAPLTRKPSLHTKDSSGLHIWPSLAQVKATQAPVVGTVSCVPLFLYIFYKCSKIVKRDGNFPLTSFGYQCQPSYPQGIDKYVGWTCCLTQFVFTKHSTCQK